MQLFYNDSNMEGAPAKTDGETTTLSSIFYDIKRK